MDRVQRCMPDVQAFAPRQPQLLCFSSCLSLSTCVAKGVGNLVCTGHRPRPWAASPYGAPPPSPRTHCLLQDPQVMDAVAELQRCKQRLAELEQLQRAFSMDDSLLAWLLQDAGSAQPAAGEQLVRSEQPAAGGEAGASMLHK